jgi:hypothetical protein
MISILFFIFIVCSCSLPASASQVIAGTPEDKMLQQITAETNADTKLQLLKKFEEQFPQSKVLPDVYLMMINQYGQKSDADKILEYGEKVLKVDEHNVTAMMILARTYSIQRKNLDRAVQLADAALAVITNMKTAPMPAGYTEAAWKDYLVTNETAAKQISAYAKGLKAKPQG